MPRRTVSDSLAKIPWRAGLLSVVFLLPLICPAAADSGPWGTLRVQHIPLENSAALFLDRAQRLEKPVWRFMNMSPAEFTSFLQQAGLSPEIRDQLLKTNQWTIESNACVIVPTDDLILKLSAADRQRLYSVLGRSDTNYGQRWPFRIPLNGFEARFECSGLSPARLDLIRQLIYTNGNELCFCDFATLQRKLSDDEFQHAVEALYAIPAVRAWLKVTPDSDINALLTYWGTYGRSRRVKPLLESLAKIPGGTEINLSFLLPPFPRYRLYVFPDPETDIVEAKADCLYTALNFFNDRPDPQYLDAEKRKAALQNDYTQVRGGRPVFGDLLTLFNSKGEAFHVAVYIAQDIVFTKNGENYLQPWVLMKMEDLMAYYGSEEPIRLMIFRRNST